MTRVIARTLGLFEHAIAIVAGFILMIVGLAFGVSMVMLPVGIVVGLFGCALFVGGLLAKIPGADS